jgi:hypothetical protein
VGEFSEGLCVVLGNGRVHLIDRRGVEAAQLTDALRGLGVLAEPGKGGDWLRAGDSRFSGGLLACTTPAGLLFVDARGNVRLSLAAANRQYHCPDGFMDGLCVVGIREQRGDAAEDAEGPRPAVPSLPHHPPRSWIEEAAQHAVEEAAQHAGRTGTPSVTAGRPESEGTFAYGLLAESGRFAVEPVYDWITPARSVCYIVSKDGLDGVLNTAGKVVVSPSSKEVDLCGDLVRLAVDEGIRWIDPLDGRVIFAVRRPPQ